MIDKSKNFEPFGFQRLDELRDAALCLKVNLPLSDKLAVLGEPVTIGGATVPNRLCVAPMEGCDAAPGGAPGPLTLRRYQRYAEGGFGMLWLEATAVVSEGRSSPRQLWINRGNVAAFAALVSELRRCARERWGHEIVVILQLAHAGRYCRPEGTDAPLIASHDRMLDLAQGVPADYAVVSDDYLARLQTATLAAGQLALQAGFDGVDLKACHGDLIAELIAAVKRPGRYGGSFANRRRYLVELAGSFKGAGYNGILASKFSLPLDAATAVDAVDFARALVLEGVQLLNLAAESPDTRFHKAEPLKRFADQAALTRAVQQALPAVPVMAGGLSWFRHFLPQVAAGLVSEGSGTLISIGRAALAYPRLAGDLLEIGALDPEGCCLNCNACLQLLEDNGQAGCIVMDSAVYGAEYLQCRHFALDNLREQARRCRGCAPAPCRAGCPTRIDVPAFLKAFAEDDIAAAYAILRRSNVLPGMCAHLCPVSSLCEGRCVAGTLDGTPIPIHDIQYAVAWSAQQRGLTGLRVPQLATGKKIAVVGGGPAGVSCAVTLLELGHQVVVFERATRLGGTPELAIRATRFTGAREEVDAILMPALRKARLTIRYGVALGREISIEDLQREHDAVFLAAGVWGEQSLGAAPGVISGLDFLVGMKSGTIRQVPTRVILLAGGDSAMDCARVALQAGATELLIVYAGALSEMHWHMADEWFRTEGVHFLTMTRPTGYRIGPYGKASGLIVQRRLGVALDGSAAPEEILEAELMIEAMGLGIEPTLKTALRGCSLTENGLVQTAENGGSLACESPGLFAGGGLINGGAAVVQCVAEGMQAGQEIDLFLKQS
ncbi:MAG: FAD-dependent oxidoreductase [Kiritimatiellae bacterium]|nr:FAD-dependent oxidoreductase [Kiritimatiellia bacterium]